MNRSTTELCEAIETKLLEQRFRLDAVVVAEPDDARLAGTDAVERPETTRGFTLRRIAVRSDGAFEAASDETASFDGLPDERSVLVLREAGLIGPALTAAGARHSDAVAILDGEDSWRATRTLFDAGYLRCGTASAAGETFVCHLRSDLVRSPDRLVGASRGIAAMSRIGSNGRFANQLFQYAFLKFYALRHDLRVATPAWDGGGLFGFKDPEPDPEALLRLSFYAFDDDDLGLWEADTPPFDIDFDGYFQELPPCWAPHRAFLRRLFDFGEGVARPLDDWVERLTASGQRKLVAIHVRRGDYPDLHAQGLGWYRPIPPDWYRAWLSGLRQSLGDFTLYVATDAPDEIVPHFADFAPITVADPSPTAGIPAHIVDFEMLRRATHLAVANSSFSRMAAILAADGQRAALPDFAEQVFKPYDPWIDPQFWERFSPRDAAVRAFGSSREAARQRSLITRLELGRSQKIMDTQATLYNHQIDEYNKQSDVYKKQSKEYSAYIVEKDNYIEELREQVGDSEALKATNEVLRRADAERLRTLSSTRLALQSALAEVKALEAVQAELAHELDIAVAAHDSAAVAYHALAAANADKDRALQTALFLGSPAGLSRRLAFRPVLGAVVAARKAASMLGLAVAAKLQDDERLLRERNYRHWLGLMRRRATRPWSKELSAPGLPAVHAQPEEPIPEPISLHAQHVADMMRIAAGPASTYDPAQASVVVVVPWLVQGGSEVVLFDVLDALRHHVNLAIVTTLEASHTMTDAFGALVREIHHLGGRLTEHESLAFIAALCRGRNARLILSSNTSLIYKNASRLKADDPDLRLFDILHNDLREGHFASAVAATAAIDRHIVVGRQIAEALRSKGVPEERITVIQNGIDVDGTFDPDHTPASEGRHFLGCGDDDFVVGYIGRMSEEKRPLAFLDIVERLRDIPKLRVVMVGSGPLDADVEVRLDTLPDAVEWRQHLARSDMSKVYAALDVLVLPSTIEGMPLVVLEAMAMGVPVAVTDVGNVRQIVDDGVNGFIVGVDAYMDLAKPVADLAGDPRRRKAMGSAARKAIVAKGLSRQAMRDRYVEVVGAGVGSNSAAPVGEARR